MQHLKPPPSDRKLRELFGVDVPPADDSQSLSAEAVCVEKTLLKWTASFLVALVLVTGLVAWSMIHFAP